MSGKEKKLTPRSARKKKAMLEAAWQVLAREGYERASLDMVLSLCGGSKATIYNYFKSKEDLFGKAVFARSYELSRRVFQDFSDQEDFITELYIFGLRYLNFYLNTDLLEISRVAMAEGKNLDYGRVLYEEGFRKNWATVAVYLEKHIEPEKFLTGGSWTAAMHLKGLLDREMLIRRAWGVMDGIDDKDLRDVVQSGITAFARIYGIEQE
ncbi:hypothetical protein C4J81_11845 [Deltaproteobacteria bacterium Smac51]|nr:hypothetical protein C4J81_11845 [Deltaproteobacteria bacterium Smac51]